MRSRLIVALTVSVVLALCLIPVFAVAEEGLDDEMIGNFQAVKTKTAVVWLATITVGRHASSLVFGKTLAECDARLSERKILIALSRSRDPLTTTPCAEAIVTYVSRD